MLKKIRKMIPMPIKKIIEELIIVHGRIRLNYFRKKRHVSIISREDSLALIIKSNKSVVRFGDGEFTLIRGKNIRFQSPDEKLSARLKEVLSDRTEVCLIGIPDMINMCFEDVPKEHYKYWIFHMNFNINKWFTYLSPDIDYINSLVTRPYDAYAKKDESERFFMLWKEVWRNRHVVLVEGEYTRFGINNDLLNEASSIERVICPAEDAFEVYEDIKSNVLTLDKSKLILISLGPTATVLAYDLAKAGFHAIDIGHLDIEYEWFLRKADGKLKIDYKYTSEADGGNKNIVDVDSETYNSQIIKKIL